MRPLLLNPDDTSLVIIDIQENLWSAMYNREEIERNASILAGLAQKAGIPVLFTEQYKKGLGPTLGSLSERLEGAERVEKLCFNCFDLEVFRERLLSFKRKTLLIAGIEAHICVLQTAVSAIDNGFTVHVVADSTGSRTEKNHTVGLERMRDAGCIITSTEAATFEVIGEAGTDLFKEMLRLVK